MMPIRMNKIPQGYETKLYLLFLRTAKRTPSIKRKVIEMENAKLVLSQVRKVKSRPGYSSSRHWD
jgi:hypothetical protein